MALNRPTAIVVGLSLAALLAFTAALAIHFENSRIAMAIIAPPDDVLPPTLEQRLLVQSAVKIERLERELADSRDAISASTTKATTRPTSTKATTKPYSVKRQATSRKPRTGVWSAEAERSRAAWRRWADAEIARLKSDNE